MEPWFGAEETQAIEKYMTSGGWLTEFQKTEEFENMIADYTGAKHCIIVNNGTISLTLAAIAFGIKPGDEVIIPNYTMIATANSIKLIGAVPVFVDVEPNTLCIDLDVLKKAVSSKTRAVIFVRELCSLDNTTKKAKDPLKGIRLLITRLGCHQVELTVI